MDSTDLSIDLQNGKLVSKTGQKIWTGVQLQVPKQGIHFVVGESGSGKSTLAWACFGIWPNGSRSSFDRFTVLGEVPGSPKLQSKLFFVPQNPNQAFHPYRKIQNQLADFFRIHGMDSSALPRLLSLWEEMGIDGEKQKEYAETLSGGEKQRICISLAILKQPKLLVLDEPTTGLDAFSESVVLSKILRLSQNGVSVLFITHDLRLVERLGSSVTIIKEGASVESLPITQNRILPKSEYGKSLMDAYVRFT